jgi:hypothetical protein
MVRSVEEEYEGENLTRKTVTEYEYEDGVRSKIVVLTYDGDGNLIDRNEMYVGPK